MKSMKTFLAACFFSGFSFSLFAGFPADVSTRARVEPAELHPGEAGKWIFTIRVPENTHISDAESGLFFIKPDTADGIQYGAPVYPKGIRQPYGTVYRGEVVVEIPFVTDPFLKIGQRILSAKIQIQPCGEANGVCYPPESQKISNQVKIIAGQSRDVSHTRQTGIAQKVTDALNRGSFLAFLFVFIGGFLTSLTPCVYPMIPITLAVIGAQASGGERKGFVLSLFYVLGISFTFSALGVAAAKTGSLFGSFSQHPAVQVIMSAVFFFMGLSMLGVFVLQMPASLAGKLRGKKRGGYAGTFLTGVIAGVLVSPCISPLLVVILAWVARSGNALLGFGLLFSFALGLGVLFVLIGTFSGILKNLPKTGGWAEYIEKSFGLLLIGLSIFFLRSPVGDTVYRMLWASFLMFFGVFIGGLSPLPMEAGAKKKASKALGLLAVIISTCLIIFTLANRFHFGSSRLPAIADARGRGVAWESSDQKAFEKAGLSGKPVVIDFYASWCAACKELEEKTWSDATVQKLLSSFIAVQLDLSKPGIETMAAQKRYDIVGMPTVIVFSSSGKELDRFTGFKPPEEVAPILRGYVSAD
jgi:thioredoxin:protein disulfide reductase